METQSITTPYPHYPADNSNPISHLWSYVSTDKYIDCWRSTPKKLIRRRIGGNPQPRNITYHTLEAYEVGLDRYGYMISTPNGVYFHLMLLREKGTGR